MKFGDPAPARTELKNGDPLILELSWRNSALPKPGYFDQYIWLDEAVILGGKLKQTFFYSPFFAPILRRLSPHDTVSYKSYGTKIISPQ